MSSNIVLLWTAKSEGAKAEERWNQKKISLRIKLNSIIAYDTKYTKEVHVTWEDIHLNTWLSIYLF